MKRHVMRVQWNQEVFYQFGTIDHDCMMLGLDILGNAFDPGGIQANLLGAAGEIFLALDKIYRIRVKLSLPTLKFPGR